jgi:AcrR family transcriptional regulator
MGHTRRRTPSGEVEQALLGAAFHLLEAEGPEALSVRRVAAEAGVAPMGVYNHFDGKNGVVDALFRTGFEALTEEIADLEQADDPVEAFKEGLRRYRRLALDHPRTYEVMFLKSVEGFEPSEASMEVATASFDGLARKVGRAIEAGEFAPADERELAQVAWAACHGVVALEIAGICMVDDLATTYEQLLDTLVEGFSAPPGRAGSRAPAARPARAR